MASFHVEANIVDDMGNPTPVTCTLPFRCFLRGGYIHSQLWKYIIEQNRRNSTVGDHLCPDVSFGVEHGAANAIKDLIGFMAYDE